MLEPVYRRGLDRALPATVIRTLTREYRITTDSAELAAILEFIRSAPEIVGVELKQIDLLVETTATGFRVRMPDGAVVEGDAEHVVRTIALHVILSVEDEAPGALVVHGASVFGNGKRAIIFGVKGTGKSTLALHLLANGIAVEGDEHVVVRDHDVIVRPRFICMKEGSLQWLPAAVADVIRTCPSEVVEGLRVYIVDPSLILAPWRIRAGAVDHLVLAEPNHGRASTLEPLPRDEAFARLLTDAWLPETQQGLAIARLRRIVLEAQCWRLRLGSLEGAESHIRRLLAL